MNVTDTRHKRHWAFESGRCDVTQHKRLMAICVVPDDGNDIPDHETPALFYWLLRDENGEPRFDEQLTDERQIISITKEAWRAFPDRQLKITYVIEYDPYWKPGWIPGKCED